MTRAKLGSHGVLEFQSSCTRVPGASTSWAPAALCDGSSDSGQAPLFMGSAPPMCHLTMFFMSAVSRDVVVFILLRCWGPSSSAICPGQQVPTKSSALNLCSSALVPTLLALGKGSGAQSSPEKEAGLCGAGLQLFRAITSCPSFISNVARVSPFEKRNQRQVRQGKEGQKSKQTWKVRKPNKPANLGWGLCGLQNFEGGFWLLVFSLFTHCLLPSDVLERISFVNPKLSQLCKEKQRSRLGCFVRAWAGAQQRKCPASCHGQVVPAGWGGDCDGLRPSGSFIFIPPPSLLVSGVPQ